MKFIRGPLSGTQPEVFVPSSLAPPLWPLVLHLTLFVHPRFLMLSGLTELHQLCSVRMVLSFYTVSAVFSLVTVKTLVLKGFKLFVCYLLVERKIQRCFKEYKISSVDNDWIYHLWGSLFLKIVLWWLHSENRHEHIHTLHTSIHTTIHKSCGQKRLGLALIRCKKICQGNLNHVTSRSVYINVW